MINWLRPNCTTMTNSHHFSGELCVRSTNSKSHFPATEARTLWRHSRSSPSPLRGQTLISLHLCHFAGSCDVLFTRKQNTHTQEAMRWTRVSACKYLLISRAVDKSRSEQVGRASLLRTFFRPWNWSRTADVKHLWCGVTHGNERFEHLRLVFGAQS